MSEKPLVTATLLTGVCPERRKMAKIAAQCFFQQDYQNKELLILNQSKESLEVENALELMISRDVFVTLGDIRNYAMDAVSRGLIAVWDDDDFAAPHYMSEMVSHWEPGRLVQYRNQMRHDIVSNSSFVCVLKSGHHGQILCDSQCGFRYPSLNAAEDTEFMKCFGRNRYAFDNDCLFYCRLAHPWNTWNRNFIMKGHQKSKNYYHRLGPTQKAFIQQIRKIYDLPMQVSG